MSGATRATQILQKAGVNFTLHRYDYDGSAAHIGLQAAAALGVDPGHVWKTLMAHVDSKPVCVIVPSDREVAMKKLAAALGGKAALMMKPADAERITGYKVGGISPFGQLRAIPVVIDEAVTELDHIYLNGGQRGLQIHISAADAITILSAQTAAITAA